MLCVALTLYYVAPAFLAPRRLIPSQSVFLERLIMPAAARRVWYYVLWLLCACGAPPGAVGLWCLVTLLCDRYLCSPHLVHFGLCCAVMTLVSSAHHQRTWLALYASLMYTFAGLQKMNPTFARGFVAGVLSPPLRRWTGLQLEQLLPAVWQLLVGYSVALVECALGLLLVCSYRYAYALIMAMHAFILLSFGPLGRADFHGIYGWNLWCMWLAWCGLGPGALWSDVRELPSLALAAFVGTFGGIPACALLCRVGERLSFKMVGFVLPRIFLHPSHPPAAQRKQLGICISHVARGRGRHLLARVCQLHGAGGRRSRGAPRAGLHPRHSLPDAFAL